MPPAPRHSQPRPERQRQARRRGRRLRGDRGGRDLPQALAFLLLCALPRWARAEVPGILLGRSVVLHPSLSAELRYDSNLFSANSGVTQGQSALVMRLIPSLSLSTLSMRRGGHSPRRVALRLQGSLDYREFLSPDPTVNVHRSFGGEVSGQLSLLPQRAMGLDIYDNFVRSNQVPYSGLPYNFGRSTNVFGLRGRYSPGGQRLLLTLTQEIGYDGSDDVVEGPKLSDFNLLTFTFSARVAWKFLPKTALFLDLTQGAMHYLSDAARLQHRADSFPLRLGGGLLGLLTPKIAVNLFAGYGYGFYLQGPSPSTAVVQAEVRVKPTFFSSATLHYRHDFTNALLGSYMDVDSVAVSYGHSVYRVSLFGRAALDRLAYRGSDETLMASGLCVDNGDAARGPCVPQTDRVDHVVSLDAKLEYPLKDWMVAGLGYGFTTNQSNGTTTLRAATTQITFLKHEAWLRLTVRY